jgi:hypothetical protein
MDVKQIVHDFGRLKAERANFDTLYQTLGEYVHQIKQSFEDQHTPGEFLLGDLYDSTGPRAAQTSSSILLSMLWPGSATQSIEIVPPDDIDNISTELSDFYEYFNKRACERIDDPFAGIIMSLDEYMLDQIVFGTSGVGVELSDGNLTYRAYGPKQLYIKEGKGGDVSELWILHRWTIDQLVGDYGLDAVSEGTADKYNNSKGQEYIDVLQVLRPRKDPKVPKGRLAKPIANIIIELADNHLVYEGGYDDLPIKVCRVRKLSDERYGRSPAYFALPDIRELNGLREAYIIATEKSLDPPLGVLSSGVLGGGAIDTSARAITVFDNTDLGNNQRPVFELFSVGDLSSALARMDQLEQSIAQHFSLDRLLNFANEVQMTLGEVNLRRNMELAANTSFFARQISEMLGRLLERSINLLWQDGVFGVVRGSEQEQELLARGDEPQYIPDELVERVNQGKDIYKIRYKTQAVGASRAQDYGAIIELMQFAAQASQINSQAAAKIDVPAAIDEVARLRSVPSGIIVQDDKFQEIIKAQQAQAQQAQALQAGQSVAGIAKDLAQADKVTNEV